LGSKNKLKRFKENLTFDNVIQPSRDELLNGNFKLKGKWNKDAFKNNNPIVLELGCGKGEYSIGLAKKILIKILLELILKEQGFGKAQKMHNLMN